MLSTLERARNAATNLSTVSTDAVHLAFLRSRRSSNPNPSMKGLQSFIFRIRQCRGAEDEERAVNEELNKIRNSFQTLPVDGYTKKKSLCKLIFIFLLGKKVTFGHLEALSLLSSNIFSEKQAGYFFVSLLYDHRSEANALLMQSIRFDLQSKNLLHIHLALKCIANIATEEVASEFCPLVLSIMNSSLYQDHILQSAVLCLLKFIKVTGSSSQYDGLAEKVLSLMGDSNLGNVLSSIALLEQLIEVNGAKREEIMRVMASELWRIVGSSRPGLSEYVYKTFPAPWHVIRILRVFQRFKTPNDTYAKAILNKALTNIIERTQEYSTRQVQQTQNIKHAVLLEAISVAMSDVNEPDTRVLRYVEWLLNQNVPNYKHLALCILSQIAVHPFHHTLDCFLNRAFTYLKEEPDVSIKRVAVEFLFSICRKSNVKEIVQELFTYMTLDSNARAAVALQIAIISERWAPDCQWYVDTLIKLVAYAGVELDDKIVYTVVNLVLAKPEVQNHAAETIFQVLQNCDRPNFKLIRISGIILGEFGNFRENHEVGMEALYRAYRRSDWYTQAILLTTFMKLAFRYPVLRPCIENFFRDCSSSNVLEIQQRAFEYTKLLKLGGCLSQIFCGLPPLLTEDLALDCSASESSTSCSTSMLVDDQKGDSDCLHLPSSSVLLKGPVRVSINAISVTGSTGSISILYEYSSSDKFLILKTLAPSADSRILLKPELPRTVQDGVIKEILSIACLGVFEPQPKLTVEYSLNGALRRLDVVLPISITTFFHATSLTRTHYQDRWNMLSSTSVSCQTILHIDDPKQVESILRKFNFALLYDVDPDPNAVVGAALFSAAGVSTGLLLKISEETPFGSYLLTVRSPDAALSRMMVAIVERAFCR